MRNLMIRVHNKAKERSGKGPLNKSGNLDKIRRAGYKPYTADYMIFYHALYPCSMFRVADLPEDIQRLYLRSSAELIMTRTEPAL